MQLVIRDLSVHGSMAAVARAAADDGRDLEAVVRQALEVGAAVLQHGSAKGTVDAVSAEVDRLMELLDAKSEHIEALVRMSQKISSAKGLGFEASLAAPLDACFAPHGDILEHTGMTRGIADALDGDYVVVVNPNDTAGQERRIVFEVKNRRRRPTVAHALEELDDAKLNRDCQVAVMVFAEQAQSPLCGKPLRVFPGNRLMVVWDKAEPGSDLALEVAAQLARTLAIAADRDDYLALDGGILADKLDELTNIIDTRATIRRSIKTARKGLDDAEEAYEGMVNDAMAVLADLQDRL